MQLKKQHLNYADDWQAPDIYLFTGNPIIKSDGGIVMGRGAAKQVRDTYPGIAQAFGRAIRHHTDPTLLFVKLAEGKIIGWLKVKEHWARSATVELIQRSVYALTAQAVANPDLTFHVNYPGIGNGKLTEADVSPLLTQLPDNVIIYQ